MGINLQNGDGLSVDYDPDLAAPLAQTMMPTIKVSEIHKTTTTFLPPLPTNQKAIQQSTYTIHQFKKPPGGVMNLSNSMSKSSLKIGNREVGITHNYNNNSLNSNNGGGSGIKE